MIRRQKEGLTQLRREVRRNNIVIQGVTDERKEEQGQLKEKIKGLMGKIKAKSSMNTDIEIQRLEKFKEEKKSLFLQSTNRERK